MQLRGHHTTANDPSLGLRRAIDSNEFNLCGELTFASFGVGVADLAHGRSGCKLPSRHLHGVGPEMLQINVQGNVFVTAKEKPAAQEDFS